MSLSIGSRIMSLFLAIGSATKAKLIEHVEQPVLWHLVEHLEIVEPNIVGFERINLVVERRRRRDLGRRSDCRIRSSGDNRVFRVIEQREVVDTADTAREAADALITELDANRCEDIMRFKQRFVE